jgi:hypothetical protein
MLALIDTLRQIQGPCRAGAARQPVGGRVNLRRSGLLKDAPDALGRKIELNECDTAIEDHGSRAALPVRIRLGVPPGGLGQRHTQMTAWLDENCGADGWAVTPSGTRGGNIRHPDRGIRFAHDSLLEGAGFEPSVPLNIFGSGELSQLRIKP